MKKILFTAILMASTGIFAQVKIGDNATTIGASSLLELESTDKALVISRVATKDAIATPVDGMVIYDNSKNCYRGRANGAWVNITPCTATLTVASPTYQGVSVIDATGIGYNGEAVPAASTITVQLTSDEPTSYTLSATDAVTGLVYSASGTIATAGTVAVVLTPNTVVMPEFSSGVLTMPLTGASNTINLLPRIDVKSIPASATTVTDVTFGTQTWMDRNLGARRVATAIDDVFAYGNNYQWGRPADGHEIVVWNGTTLTSSRGFYDATATLATTDSPGFPEFITNSSSPQDWRSDNNNNRWATANQGPCPTGYHVPTEAEWQTADTWNNVNDTFTTLKITLPGNRPSSSNSFVGVGGKGEYWSSTIWGGTGGARDYRFTTVTASTSGFFRASGLTVRCKKN